MACLFVMGQNDSKNGPDYSHETAMMKRHGLPVAGVDEAGRGPWAGPVVAAAVILDANKIPDGLHDSKKLSAGKRAKLYEAICLDHQVGVAISDVGRIDRDNILHATLWAMGKAIQNLGERGLCALIDGNKTPVHSGPCECLVKGDSRSQSIAAASIVAKVTRDRMMVEMAEEFPGYGFERHKGYGTSEHQAALHRLGVTPHHRRSFAPVRALLE